MKTLSAVLVLLLLAGSIPALAAGTVVHDSLFSQSLGYYQHVNIYLPQGYTPADHYPVIYFLHGIGNTCEDYAFTVTVLDAMIGAGQIAPVIFVRPNGMCPPYGGSMWTNSEMYGAYEDWVAHEVIPFVDSHYSTLPHRQNRVIMGHSMGGFGALNVALKHADLFNAVYSMSGFVDLEPISLNVWTQILCMENGGAAPYVWNPSAGFFSGGVFTAAGAFSPDFASPPYMVDFPLDENANWILPVLDHWYTHMPPATLRQNVGSLTGLHIFLDCGTLDELSYYSQNLAFCDSLTALGVPYSYTSFTGGHSDHVVERFQASLQQLDQVLPVELTAFDAECVAGGIRLTWTTATEFENAGFELLRNDLRAATLTGAGTSPSEHHYAWLDESVREGETYTYTLYGIRENGSRDRLAAKTLRYDGVAAAVSAYALHQNYPNPFNPSTTIEFDLKENGLVRLSVYDLLGHEVAVLVNEHRDAGTYRVTFNGRGLPSGLYLCKLKASGFTALRKIILAR